MHQGSSVESHTCMASVGTHRVKPNGVHIRVGTETKEEERTIRSTNALNYAA